MDPLEPLQRPGCSKPAAQILRDFTYSYVREQGSLDILSAALFPSSLGDSTLPSWVPTFLGRWPPGSQIGYPKPSYSAAGATSVLLSDLSDLASLRLHGMRIDKIESVPMETCTGEGKTLA